MMRSAAWSRWARRRPCRWAAGRSSCGRAGRRSAAASTWHAAWRPSGSAMRGGVAQAACFDRQQLVLPRSRPRASRRPARWPAPGTAHNNSRACCATRCTACCASCSSAGSCWPRWAPPRPLSACSAPSGIYHALISISSAGQVTIDKHRRPGGRGLDHDRRRAGGGDSRGARPTTCWAVSLVVSRPIWRASRAICVNCCPIRRSGRRRGGGAL